MRVAVSLKGGVVRKVRAALAADAYLEARGRGPVQGGASAILSASTTRLARVCVAIDQPTIARENASCTAAR
jgi:phage terminase large subunit-like protein